MPIGTPMDAAKVIRCQRPLPRQDRISLTNRRSITTGKLTPANPPVFCPSNVKPGTRRSEPVATLRLTSEAMEGSDPPETINATRRRDRDGDENRLLDRPAG